MSKKLDKLRTGEDLARHALNHPATKEHRQTGSHLTVKTAKGSVTIPRHRKELGKGLWRKIVKQMLAIGLGVLVALVIAWFFHARSEAMSAEKCGNLEKP